MTEYKYYYQIDYIDENGLATYIETYHNEITAIKDVNTLNRANRCISGNTKFVLDEYRYIEDVEDSDEITVYNITGAKTIDELKGEITK